MLLVARLFGFLVRESHFLVGRVCLVPVNTALCPVCGFCVPGFWVRGAVSCGARRAGRSGQVLWVVAEQCRTQFPYQPFRY